MTNKGSSHRHGMVGINARRPKSKIRKRINKNKAHARKAPLLSNLKEAIAKKAA